jgi:hypothetical protein
MLHRLHGWQRLPLPYEQGGDAPRRIGLGKATPRLTGLWVWSDASLILDGWSVNAGRVLDGKFSADVDT